MFASPHTADELRCMIAGVYPELAGARMSIFERGYDSVAVDVDDRWFFKFPRSERAAGSLRKEAALLTLLRPAVTMRVPEMILHEAPILFSRHAKIAGEHLPPEDYRRLAEAERARLAADLALFYAELHRLEPAVMAAAGAPPVQPWLPPDEMLRRVVPLLPEKLRDWARRSVEAWQGLAPDPLGEVYGYFDGHGWNMAFDHTAGRLNGLYDFADSGIGPAHQDFIYSNWIERDLTRRIVRAFHSLTGHALDEERIELLTGILRLNELAEDTSGPEHTRRALETAVRWANDISQRA